MGLAQVLTKRRMTATHKTKRPGSGRDSGRHSGRGSGIVKQASASNHPPAALRALAFSADAGSAVAPCFQPQWLGVSPARDVVALLGEESIRFVGGAVRESLLGYPVRDIDAATTYRPEDVMRLARAHGVNAVPTGLKHGTVTLVFPSASVEVTSLRRDVATDGRRATVAFTDDWAEDAKRRDFTVNAIYLSANGVLYDPEGGLDDLASGRLRFIGDTQARIREDYLRILRYFRFSAHPQFAAGIKAGLEHISTDIAVIEREVLNLRRVSKERLWSECLAWFQRDDIIPSLKLATHAGVMDAVFGADVGSHIPDPSKNADWPHLSAVQAYDFLCNALGCAPEPLMRILSMFIGDGADSDCRLNKLRDWPLSRHERRTLKELESARAAITQPHAAEAATFLYWYSPAVADVVVASSLMCADPAGGGAAVKKGCQPQLEHYIAARQNWVKPHFPLTAGDLTAAGLHAGPALGRALRACEVQWVTSGFALTRDELVKNAIRFKTLNEN